MWIAHGCRATRYKSNMRIFVLLLCLFSVEGFATDPFFPGLRTILQDVSTIVHIRIPSDLKRVETVTTIYGPGINSGKIHFTKDEIAVIQSTTSREFVLFLSTVDNCQEILSDYFFPLPTAHASKQRALALLNEEVFLASKDVPPSAFSDLALKELSNGVFWRFGIAHVARMLDENPFVFCKRQEELVSTGSYAPLWQNDWFYLLAALDNCSQPSLPAFRLLLDKMESEKDHELPTGQKVRECRNFFIGAHILDRELNNGKIYGYTGKARINSLLQKYEQAVKADRTVTTESLREFKRKLEAAETQQ